MSCKCDCVQKLLESAFYKYGHFVSRYPLPFIIVPLIITAISSAGVLRMQETDDPEYLYTPVNGPAKTERKIFKDLFKENDSFYFMPTRKAELDGYLNVIITDKNDGNLFTNSHMDKLIALNEQIKDTAFKNETLSYVDVCGSWKGQCLENILFDVLNGTGQTIDSVPITYPQYKNIYFLASQLGGVEVNQHGVITSAKAVMLFYFVRYTTEEDRAASDEWLTEIRHYLLQYEDELVKVNLQTSLSINEELAKSTEGVLPQFVITYSILFGFCAISCTMSDWVRTKVWVVMAGQFAAIMAVITAFGIMCALGTPFTTTVASMPFLIAGIGIDDMFVILSSWRHTSYTLPSSERMAKTMQVAAISITVTSITDALAFGIGAITVFRSVTLFCAFTGVAVVFSYIYAITFLAGCFALSGKNEERNHHELTCRKVLPLDQAGDKSRGYRMFCAGGYLPDTSDTSSPDKTTDRYSLPMVTQYIKHKFAPFLMKTAVKCCVLLVYVVYLVFAVWGCYALREEKGFKLKNLALSSSYLIPYYDFEEKYFRQTYGPRVMVAVTEPVDYSSHSVREELSKELDTFRNSTFYFSSPEYTESWLTSFLMYLNQTRQNPADMASFIQILRTQFLTRPPFDIFKLDVSFNKNYTEILASRFLLQSKGIEEDMNGDKTMTASREFAEDSSFEMTVYHPTFIYVDQLTVIYSNTFQNLAIAVGSMLIVSMILLPSIVSVVCVTVSVISICMGVLGYMALWDVGLDSVSMINLIMCIGFSVDFSAHISYHFSISKAPDGNSKAIEALGHIGTPILQGALSTILAVLILSTSQSYIFTTFFKIMFLVMVFGFFHAMFLLPTVLSLTDTKCLCGNSSDNEKSVHDVYKPNSYGPVKLNATEMQKFIVNDNDVIKNEPSQNKVEENGDCKNGKIPNPTDKLLVKDVGLKSKVDEDDISLYDNA